MDNYKESEMTLTTMDLSLKNSVRNNSVRDNSEKFRILGSAIISKKPWLFWKIRANAEKSLMFKKPEITLKSQR